MRPVVHFTAESGWINDPHGITFRDGGYHVFFQYVPGQTVWGPACHWGHAVGKDLLSLREDTIAIAPGDGDGGIWTGSLVTDGAGRARVFYTSTSAPDYGIGRIRTATPGDDEWHNWHKGNFVADAPPDLDLLAYRDPFLRREGETWRMFVGAGLTDGTAMALSYTSEDLDRWEYAGVALQRSTSKTEPVWMGALWECPQIFELDGRAVMVSSVWDADVLHYAGYAVGRYDDGVFQAESWGRLTFGKSYYAPSLFTDAEGRPCLLFWMRGVGDPAAGWEGAHSVPYILSLDDDRLVAQPHADVAEHRRPGLGGRTVAGLAADIEWRAADSGTLTIESGADAAVTIVRDGDMLHVRRSGEQSTTPVSGDVRVIMDGPVLEVSSAAGLFGASIRPAGVDLTVTATAGELDVFPLV
ncbi:glycoside hydrolase family 32 protein [Microbacterium sp. HD4P20]|uniref:glycoside hydrolase family 32 protein n=1 Tax=Microbacterium sp. HD4P20 TaxID=2864874 RepID=UPI001C63D6ED|nr:glycoside hydrolase family 32 protein [Microbacterium sp. HD4P20]MCP2636076.1 glycoside hydrolase family 32 protein [Microbacterium sp. HD4P20]